MLYILLIIACALIACEALRKPKVNYPQYRQRWRLDNE
jgi:hypothetical protein